MRREGCYGAGVGDMQERLGEFSESGDRGEKVFSKTGDGASWAWKADNSSRLRGEPGGGPGFGTSPRTPRRSPGGQSWCQDYEQTAPCGRPVSCRIVTGIHPPTPPQDPRRLSVQIPSRHSGGEGPPSG